MKIAVLSRKDSLYSTNRLFESAKERGHEVHVINYLNCHISVVNDEPQLHYGKESLSTYDAIIPRIGASFTFFGSAVVRQFEMMHKFTVNSSQAIVRSRDKLRTHQILARAKVPMPSTGFARTPEVFQEVVQNVGGYPVILKLISGTHGSGVVIAENKRQAKSTLDAFYSLKTHILIQEFIEEAGGSDIRAFVVDGKVVGAMKRTASDGDFRSNLHKGGTAEKFKLNKEGKAIAVKATQALGLNMAGVDMMESKRGFLVLEVNSSPGLEGIEKSTQIDIAGKVIDFIEKYAQTKKKRDRISA